MKEDICSIPINELFEPKTGCPLCRMDKMLEDRLAELLLFGGLEKGGRVRVEAKSPEDEHLTLTAGG